MTGAAHGVALAEALPFLMADGAVLVLVDGGKGAVLHLGEELLEFFLADAAVLVGVHHGELVHRGLAFAHAGHGQGGSGAEHGGAEHAAQDTFVHGNSLRRFRVWLFRPSGPGGLHQREGGGLAAPLPKSSVGRPPGQHRETGIRERPERRRGHVLPGQTRWGKDGTGKGPCARAPKPSCPRKKSSASPAGAGCSARPRRAGAG